MEIEIGIGLIRLADPSRGGDLLPRITGVRQAVASDIGIVLAQGPHSRQHAIGREPVPHQDCQQPGGGRRGLIPIDCWPWIPA